jgi:hypothetical protein
MLFFRLFAALAISGAAVLGALAAIQDLGKRSANGWGIDACLSCHVSAGEVPAYLQLLQGAKIRWLRERSMNAETARVWRSERGAGYRVVAFAGLPRPVPVEQDGDQLPEDLLAVYRESARLSAETRGLVSAWEMVGEPETFYCHDLPDRVAAYQKAVYLGLKDGSAGRGSMGIRHWALVNGHASPVASPLVLTGAFAFPPGPWGEVAAANGLYDYTDAINVHHYGFARDFGNVIVAHREAAEHWRKGLPVWVTEVGLDNAPYGDPENAAARRAQADYLLSCARQAIAQKVSVFMPFVLAHRGDPFSMTRSAEAPYPAWTDYAAFTRAHRLEEQPPPANAPSRVILQWIPDNDTCIPSKIARAYWFDDLGPGEWQPIEGELRVYNFEDAPARVRLEMALTSPRLRVTCASWSVGRELEIPAMGCVKLPLTLSLEGANYLRAALRCTARVAGEKSSQVEFGIGTPPAEELAHEVMPLKLVAPADDRDFAYISEAPFETTERNAGWLGINGARPRDFQTGEQPAIFDVTDRNVDPLSPPMAIAQLPEGLPAARNGHLRVQVRDASGRPAAVRVDVIDRDGQRFSIVENLGRTPDVNTGDTVWLAYADFHPWVFGRCRAGAKFDPTRMREIQLRFYGAEAGKQFQVRVDAADFK